MGKIGDLWVRLGLKSEDYKKGMADAEKSTEGFGGVISKIKGVAVAAWAAIGVAVMKFASDAIKETQKWGDAWAATMAGIQSAWNQFVVQISSGEGWNNLFANMDEAFRRGKKLAEAMDEIFERKISFGYSQAVTERDISELQKIMRDSSKSDAERKAAADEIIKKEKELADLKKTIWSDEARNYRDQFQLRTGLNDEQTDFLVKEYNLNRDIINQAREYYNERERLSKQKTGGIMGFGSPAAGNVGSQISDASAKLAELEARTSDTVKSVARMVAGYDKGNDVLVQGMADAEIAVINIDTEANRASLRAIATAGSLGKAIETNIKQPLQDMSATIDRLIATVEAREDRIRDFWHGVLEDVISEGDAMLAEIQNDADLMQEAINNGLTQAVTPDIAYEMGDLVSGAMNAAVEGFRNSLDELFSTLASSGEIDGQQLTAAFVKPLAEMAEQAGGIMMSMAAGMIAVKKAITNPWALLAAGAALVAIGAAGKAALNKTLNGGTASATSTQNATESYNVTSQEMTVYVKGEIKGNDILLSGDRAQAEWNK